MRKSHRSPTEKIEDAFADLAVKDQELALRMLQSLHRQKRRESEARGTDRVHGLIVDDMEADRRDVRQTPTRDWLGGSDAK